MISPWCSGSGGIWILGISRFELRWPQMTSADLKAIRLLYSIWESHLPGVRSAVLAYLEIASLQARTPTWTAYFTCLTSASNQKSLMLLSLEDTLLIRSWSYLLFSFQDSFHAFARNEDGWSIPVPCPNCTSQILSQLRKGDIQKEMNKQAGNMISCEIIRKGKPILVQAKVEVLSPLHGSVILPSLFVCLTSFLITVHRQTSKNHKNS